MSNSELTAETVAKLARLSRLDVPAEELGRLTEDLAKILAYVRALQEVDTDGVEPTAHVQIERLPWRADEEAAGLEREAVLEQAPRHSGEGFSVPTFVEE